MSHTRSPWVLLSSGVSEGRGQVPGGGEAGGRQLRSLGDTPVRSPNGKASYISTDLGCTELSPEGLPSSSRQVPQTVRMGSGGG